MPTAANPLMCHPLTYASVANASPRALAPALRWATIATLLGGLAGLSCAVLMRSPREWAAAHGVMMAMVSIAAWRASRTLRYACAPFPTLTKRDWPAMDALAAVSMFFIGVLPWIATLKHTDIWHWGYGQSMLGAMVLVLAMTSLRHRKRYRALAAVLGPAGHSKTAYALNSVGDTRSTFEAAWFGCVAVAMIGPAVHWFGRRDAEDLSALSLIAVYACGWMCIAIWAGAIAVMARSAFVAGRAPVAD